MDKEAIWFFFLYSVFLQVYVTCYLCCSSYWN